MTRVRAQAVTGIRAQAVAVVRTWSLTGIRALSLATVRTQSGAMVSADSGAGMRSQPLTRVRISLWPISAHLPDCSKAGPHTPEPLTRASISAPTLRPQDPGPASTAPGGVSQQGASPPSLGQPQVSPARPSMAVGTGGPSSLLALRAFPSASLCHQLPAPSARSLSLSPSLP